MKDITVIGAGLTRDSLTVAALRTLRSGAYIILHTDRIGCAEQLAEEQIPFVSLDGLYEACDDFDTHAREAAKRVSDAAQQHDRVVYVVYDIRDRSVRELCLLEPKAHIIPGPPVEGPLMAFLDGSVKLLEASDWENFELSPQDNALVRELNSREMASEVKLKLMECYPEEQRVYLLNGDGSIARLPLYDMDRLKSYDHRSCVLVTAQRDLMKLERYGFGELIRIMRILQGPGGCPWDREQTRESLRPYLLEETYEVIDAINDNDPDHLYDELGDLLMQIVMQAELGRQHGEFDITDATTAISRKMIDRHTHIFGKDIAENSEEVLELWARNKMKERGQKSYTETLREVSRSFPALLRAAKLAAKADHAGVRCTDAGKLCREAANAVEAVSGAADREEALGNALFSVCVFARALRIDPELALNAASERFITRFEKLEKAHSLPAEGDVGKDYWKQVKLS